jgi:hypothetical protein
MKHVLIALALAATACVSAATSPATAQGPVAQRAERQAVITDAAWLAGRWVGEGLGGAVEEVWSPPIGPLMIGHFTLAHDGALVFSEHMMIAETAEGLVLRVKHFNSDFTGWEESGESVDFAFVSAAPGELRFRGLIFRAVGEERLEITLTMRQSGGSVRDELFTFHRAPL